MPPLLAALGAVGASAGIGAGAVAATATTAAVAASTAAVIGGTIITAGTIAGTGAFLSNRKRQAASQARTASERFATQQSESRRFNDAQIKALENRQARDESQVDEARVRLDAREKQRRKIASASGRRSTILTSPLGITGQGSTKGGKTLIGT